MSDEEDWMALADKPIDQIKVNKTEEKEAVEFIDKPKQETIQSQPKNEEHAAKKNKLNDAGAKHDAKRKIYEDAFNEKQPKKVMTQEERLLSEQLSKKSDERNINELFMDVIGDKQQVLEDREAYIAFAKKIGGVVGQAKLKMYIQDFMTQLIDEIYPKISSVEYQAISDKVKVKFNEKQKEEKPPTKKKTKGPTANLSKGTAKNTGYNDSESDDYDAPVSKGKYNDDDFM
eukprot:CAMPEP_0176435136 /NCGR_PEP_ID=MMETSP0127-20121128/17121_1 /TAXON_ID=938130 /ORGANISM="Platyophrya macrostoma, Strain WH" /LENGTH=230 /DNA_ID=CAMNT_0017818063 /DNA_START=77 /DNA_END=769 /DNA_ORIENTATION=-